MKIFILRHAESVGNERKIIDSISPKFDLGLSIKGKKQAKELVNKLNKYKFDVFIVSHLTRTIETLNPYLKTLKNPKIIINDLTLERDAGELIGKSLTARKEYIKKKKIKDAVSFKPKNGESVLGVYKRAKKFIIFLKKNFKDEKILICGHSHFLRCFEIALTKKDIKDFYSFSQLKNGELREFSI